MTTQLPHIPLPYRILLLWLEPFLAFNGALLCHFNPTSFLNTMSETAVYAPSNQVVYDQLAATYVLFAWNQAVVLRLSKDIRIWKAIVLGIMVCDTIHLYASWRVMGTEMFVQPWLWRPEDWVNLALLYGPVTLRLLFIMEVGFMREDKQKI
ncbi:hypothetical protein K469DRAFT_731511 [Zopfia rhizophila CBS 207.26]|uniref:DUF7704 domain-containing protein n=1 Tax=Zopfia rhizophila CBS 207.26 TaxID=1314779 RepID=A0A6A6DJ58_9PEZI|nr:hypothetical protein K469DRAFT_731511 [Zopfia rhizophila CBS 207.26]